MVFRSHPQLVQGLFNAHWCGPPPRVTGGSAWPRIDHPASGLPRTTRRAVRTRFRFGSAIGFASPPRATRRLIMQKARSHPARRLLQLGGARVQVLFHSPRGVLFTFPSRYWFAIGRRLVFSLGGWAPRIQAGFHVSRPTWDAGRLGRGCAHGAVTLCGGPFQALALAAPPPSPGPATPPGRPGGLGILRVRSPLLAESLLSSLPPATEMFHFAGSRARPPMRSVGGAPLAGGGLPHSDTPGSKAACASPGLFAACRVLHRLPPPRHPPRARTAWTPKSAPGRPCVQFSPKGVCCLTKKRRCTALHAPRTPFKEK